MMYNQKLAAAIKVNGKVLREFKDTVYVPFACEYSILIKNLNTVRVIVNVYIDGSNQTPNGLVVNAGQEINLERSIKNNNLTEGNRFKFIERTDAVEQHRGVGLEDGVVRIEYQFEKPYIAPVWISDNTYRPTTTWTKGNDFYNSTTAISSTNAVTRSGTSTSASINVNNVQVSGQAFYNDAGVTVPGSKSNQTFTTTGWFPTETEKHTIVLKLLGATPNNTPIASPVTVKHKPKCITCGKQNKATAKFCTECGTALEIFA